MSLKIRLSAATPINIIAYICIIFMFTPLMRQYYLWYEVAAFLLFFVLTLPKFVHCVSHNKVMLLVSIYLLVEILYRVMSFSSAGLGNYSYRVMRMIAVWMFFFFTEYTDSSTKRNAFLVTILSLGINLVDNLRLWMFNADASELAYRYSDTVGKLNVGRTDFQYCIAIFALVLIAYLFTRNDFEKSRLNKLVLFVLVCLSGAYLIFYAQSTTMQLTTLLAFGVILIFRKQTQIASASWTPRGRQCPIINLGS